MNLKHSSVQMHPSDLGPWNLYPSVLVLMAALITLKKWYSSLGVDSGHVQEGRWWWECSGVENLVIQLVWACLQAVSSSAAGWPWPAPRAPTTDCRKLLADHWIKGMSNLNSTEIDEWPTDEMVPWLQGCLFCHQLQWWYICKGITYLLRQFKIEL